MQLQLLIKRKYIEIILLDFLTLTAIYMLPAFSHLLSVPLYVFEPMRIVLFFGYIFSRNSVNTCFLAFSIPFFSMITSGHPVFFKALIISFELISNILLLIFLFKRKKYGFLISLLISTIVSKIIYYFSKYLLLSAGLITGDLISTGIINQFIVLLLIALMFAVFLKSSFWKSNNVRG